MSPCKTIVKKSTIGYFYFLWTTWDCVWSLGTPWTLFNMFPLFCLNIGCKLEAKVVTSLILTLNDEYKKSTMSIVHRLSKPT